jgi:hypothetical protein
MAIFMGKNRFLTPIFMEENPHHPSDELWLLLELLENGGPYCARCGREAPFTRRQVPESKGGNFHEEVTAIEGEEDHGLEQRSRGSVWFQRRRHGVGVRLLPHCHQTQ